MRRHTYSIKEASERLGCGHRKLHKLLADAGAIRRDATLPVWRASEEWQREGLLREHEYQFHNQTTGRYQWGVKILLTDAGLAAFERLDALR